MAKEYLDYVGLKDYDGRIKNWVINHLPEGYDDTEIRAMIQNILDTMPEEYDDTELRTAIGNLEILVGNESVADQISTAIAAIVDSAPESFDTLKEIADWIDQHGAAATALIETVADQGEAITALQDEVSGIKAISGTYIEALFLDPVTVEQGATVQSTLNSLTTGQKLVLTDDVTEDLVITKDAVIEADGVNFSGTITVNEDVAVTIIGATFSGEVIINPVA